MAKGARTRQADFVWAALLCGAGRGLRHRTFYDHEPDRPDGAQMDSVAHVLGVLRRRLFHRGWIEPGDEDPGAVFRELARIDVFSIRRADGRASLGEKSGKSLRPGACDARTFV